MKKIYQDKVQGYKTSAASFVLELTGLSYTRLAAFLITGVLIMLFAASGWIVPVVLTALTGAVWFALTLRSYNRITADKKRVEFLIQINGWTATTITRRISTFSGITRSFSCSTGPPPAPAPDYLPIGLPTPPIVVSSPSARRLLPNWRP